MLRTTPFARMAVLTAAVAAAFAGGSIEARQQALLGLSKYKSRGKSGKRPRHPSKRFVAQDKRDAIKARNRRR